MINESMNTLQETHAAKVHHDPVLAHVGREVPAPQFVCGQTLRVQAAEHQEEGDNMTCMYMTDIDWL